MSLVLAPPCPHTTAATKTHLLNGPAGASRSASVMLITCRACAATSRGPSLTAPPSGCAPPPPPWLLPPWPPASVTRRSACFTLTDPRTPCSAATSIDTSHTRPAMPSSLWTGAPPPTPPPPPASAAAAASILPCGFVSLAAVLWEGCCWRLSALSATDVGYRRCRAAAVACLFQYRGIVMRLVEAESIVVWAQALWGAWSWGVGFGLLPSCPRLSVARTRQAAFPARVFVFVCAMVCRASTASRSIRRPPKHAATNRSIDRSTPSCKQQVPTFDRIRSMAQQREFLVDGPIEPIHLAAAKGDVERCSG